MKFSLFSFILGAAGGAAFAAWAIKASTATAANTQPSTTSGLPPGAVQTFATPINGAITYPRRA